jgi:hypothetical protein
LETFVRNFIWETENLKILDPSFEKRDLEFTFFVHNLNFAQILTMIESGLKIQEIEWLQ